MNKNRCPEVVAGTGGREMTDKLRKIAYEYWCTVQALIDFRYDCDVPLYGLNQRRLELHEELCETGGFPQTYTETITNNMDRFANFQDFFMALCEEIHIKKEQEGRK